MHFLGLNQAEILMSSLKQIIEKLHHENKKFQSKNHILRMENENLASTNVNLLEEMKKLEKESCVKNKRFVIAPFF